MLAVMATVGSINVKFALHPKWWMRPALWLAGIGLQLGLIRDKASIEYVDGVMPAGDRAAQWLANYAFRITVVSE